MLLSRVLLAAKDEAIHRRGGIDCAAETYARTIGEEVPVDDGIPVFDVELLGLGGEGHMLSVFPGSETFADTSPTSSAPRATLSCWCKARVRRQSWRPLSTDAHEPRQLPGRLAMGANGTWFWPAVLLFVAQ